MLDFKGYLVHRIVHIARKMVIWWDMTLTRSRIGKAYVLLLLYGLLYGRSGMQYGGQPKCLSRFCFWSSKYATGGIDSIEGWTYPNCGSKKKILTSEITLSSVVFKPVQTGSQKTGAHWPDKYPEARRLKSSGGWLWETRYRIKNVLSITWSDCCANSQLDGQPNDRSHLKSWPRPS